MAKIGLKLTPELIGLLLILGIAAWLRFYQLADYMNFLGDEGRDALVVKEILVNGNLPFIGPPTSVGGMYLGPLYYYMMVVPMVFWWLNPVAAAGMNALIGVLTVGLVYYLARAWFGRAPAGLAAALYAISPVAIIYSRSSWNPNPTPFFALLAVVGLYKARMTANFGWFVLTGASIAATLQMHYLALILLPVFGVMWLYELSLLKRRRVVRDHFWKGTLLAIGVFGVIMSPLVLFDLKHDFMNWKAFQVILQGGSGPVQSGGFIERIWPIYSQNLIGRYLAGQNWLVAVIVSILVVVPLIYAGYLKFKGKALAWSYLLLGVWLVIGMIGIANYKGPVYDHYLGFLNPVPYLLLAAFVSLLKAKWRWGVVGILLVGLGWLNLAINPLQFPPNRQLARTQEVARFIIDQSAGQPFNFALLAKHNYDDAYQFYLDYYGQPAKILPQAPTELLWVVCEEAVCEPINNPQYEIVVFGWSKVMQQSEVAGVKVFKLVPNPH